MKTTTRLQASLSLDPLASVVSIAGTDPSGGAGIQADIKAISATGCYAASESLFSRKILAILSPKLVRITRLKVGPDSSCVRHALAHSRLRAVASTMTLRRDAFPASPVNARLSWALRLALLLQCSPVSSPVSLAY
jgi:hypothetical protein